MSPLVPRHPPRLAACLALAGSAFVALPPLAEGFDRLGFQLEIGHRDFRVHNNFGDPEANDNLQHEPMFPGWYGADQAIWKGAAEWGSRLRGGSGDGDPSQPSDLGSGEANFDFFFSGRATSNGEVGDDTHGEIDGCAGGVQAFTEFFTNGTGFRTRYYGCWLWVDGPEGDWQGSGGWLDLQGIATHEFGHALGLGHSSDPSATMYATTSDGKSHRSLEDDDIIGIQTIYGVRGMNKPDITEVLVEGDLVTVTGARFAPAGNEVWLTSGASSAGTDPIVLSGLDSTANGTVITFTRPVGAWSGDLLVKTGDTGADLSPAFPIDLDRCSEPTTYCVSSPNSTGTGALITAEGSRSVSRSEFSLRVTRSVPNQFGLFFYGAEQNQAPVGNGTLCISAPFFRLAPIRASSSGMASMTLDFEALSGAGVIESGSNWNFQWWYRDPAAGGSKYNFSNAVEVEFCP